ncbi:MAG: hypothetical protein II007_10990 [Gammaproteobacteria bacterium]|nr:hypothetical protein [Gammaproteobacteria bacterium]
MRAWFWLIGLGWPLLAQAAIVEDERWALSSFGTLGVSHFSEQDADFVRYRSRQGQGPGNSRDYAFWLDSVVGVQLDYRLGEQLHLAVQGVYQQQPDGEPGADLTLGLLRWEVNPALELRLGRMQAIEFIDGETWLVNYANIWARPPAEVYFATQIPYRDGIALRTQQQVGDWWLFWHLGWVRTRDADFAYGQSSPSGTTDLEGPEGRLQVVVDGWLWHMAVTYHKRSLYSPTLEPLIQAIALIDPVLAASVNPDRELMPVYDIGTRWQSERWLMQVEGSYRDSETVTPSSYAAYLTLGYYPMPQTLLYGTAATINTFQTLDAGNSPAAPLLEQAYRALDGDRWSMSIGVRHALGDNLMGRLQLDYVVPDQGSNGLYQNQSADYPQADPPPALLWSVNVDFLF